MTEPQEDILDSLVTLHRATVHALADHTGRNRHSVRHTLRMLRGLGYAVSTRQIIDASCASCGATETPGGKWRRGMCGRCYVRDRRAGIIEAHSIGGAPVWTATPEGAGWVGRQ